MSRFFFRSFVFSPDLPLLLSLSLPLSLFISPRVLFFYHFHSYRGDKLFREEILRLWITVHSRRIMSFFLCILHYRITIHFSIAVTRRAKTIRARPRYREDLLAIILRRRVHSWATLAWTRHGIVSAKITLRNASWGLEPCALNLHLSSLSNRERKCTHDDVAYLVVARIVKIQHGMVSP